MTYGLFRSWLWLPASAWPEKDDRTIKTITELPFFSYIAKNNLITASTVLRKLLLYYLTLFYAVAQFKPITIWFADVISHACFNGRHQKVVHRHNGEDHLHTEIGKAAKEEAPAGKNALARADEDVKITTTTANPLLLRQTNDSPDKTILQGSILPTVLLAVQIPPPRLG